MKNFYKNKKILVTGGTGMIGLPLVKILDNFGAKITVASLEKNTSLPKKTKFFKLDLRNLKNCLRVTKNIDYVFHLAGIKGSPVMAKKFPYRFMSPMLMFNANIIDASIKNKVKRLLFTSSIGVYKPAKILREKDVWNTFPSKNDWYAGWAKRIGELNIDAAKMESKMKCTTVRPANVFGPYDNFDEKTGMVVPSLISKFFKSKNNKVEVFGDGSNIRDFIFSEDVARAMVLIMYKNPERPVNIGSGKGYTIKQMVKIINSYFNNKFKIIWNTNVPTGDQKRILDNNRLKYLGFKNTQNLKEGLFKTLEWYKKNRNNNFKKYNSFKNND